MNTGNVKKKPVIIKYKPLINFALIKINPEQLQELINEIDVIIENIQQVEEENRSQIEQVHPSFRKGAKNLVHYRAIRRMEITKLQ
jgi:pyruvate kinase